MKHFAALLALPTTLLNVVLVHAEELPWPQNLPRTVKYYPEDEQHVKRELEAQEKLAWQVPSAVKKMADDEGEKFFLGYWGFGDDTATQDDWKNDVADLASDAPERLEQHSNASIAYTLHPAIAPHSKNGTSKVRLFGRSIFVRDFQCPTGTDSCASIGQPNLCCDVGETCVSTTDGVGCCPSGETCGNNVSGCDTADGYTSCPYSPNGGCCIPGAVCKGVGCVFHGTQTVILSSRASSTVYPTRSILVTTTTVTLTPSGYTTTQTLIIAGSTTQTCKQNYFTCPASLGGGCCPNGQACGSDGTCPDISQSTSATPLPPVLKTSVSVSPETFSSTTPYENCPTGFYMCSARYLGGCCRVGRNCETTSCPTHVTKTVIDTSQATVVVTSGRNAEATGGTCANGWFLCGVGGGGGCCPSGYNCGGVSCIAVGNGQRNTGKMAPSSANVVRWAWSFLLLGVAAGVGMVCL